MWVEEVVGRQKYRSVPKLCRHKRSGKGFVVDPRSGSQVTLGVWGSAECTRAYAEWVATYSRDVGLKMDLAPSRPRTINGIVAFWLDECAKIYKRSDGRSTGELSVIFRAKQLLAPFGHLPPEKITRGDLITIRDELAAKGLKRPTVHKYISVIIRCFSWAEQRDWFPADLLAKLSRWERLRPDAAPAAGKLEAIPRHHLNVIAGKLTKKWKDLFLWHLYTGQRVETALSVCVEDLDTSRTPWRYRPKQHKSLWRGGELTILVGPKARAILKGQMEKIKSGLLFPLKALGRSADYQGPRQYFGYGRAFRNACRRGRLDGKGYTPKAVRHTAATFLRSEGVDEGIVGAILGHGGGVGEKVARTGSHTITGRYAQVYTRLVEKVVERFG